VSEPVSNSATKITNTTIEKRGRGRPKGSKNKKPKAKKLRSRIDRTALLFHEAAEFLRPPEQMTVTEWAERHRVLSAESSAEPGRWRTARTPYLKEPMNAFTDPRVDTIVIWAGSQIGKTECVLNMIGYEIDIDPGSAMYVMPADRDVRRLSVRRIAPMIRDSARLRARVSDARSRDSQNTIQEKTYPGGSLTMVGSNSASGLASTPVKYVFGDELDRWGKTAGTEGDPWELAKARTKTFYNRKMVAVSTPTVKGSSRIEALYEEGTMETWRHACPSCGKSHELRFVDVKFKSESRPSGGAEDFAVFDVHYACPSCGAVCGEDEIKKAPASWHAARPEAIERGVRSFKLSGLSSPWQRWESLIRDFLKARHDPAALQVVMNTGLGELWEDRGEAADEGTMLYRREAYGAELPEGVLVLTCGVDVQDDRLEYEVVGHGLYGETWGVKRGVIPGKPEIGGEAWAALDDVLGKTWKFADGGGLEVSMTCVDSGGHYTQDVYWECARRQHGRVFAIKGKGGDGVPYVAANPTRADIRKQGKRIGRAFVYIIGVDSGKAKIMGALRVQTPGPKYCHFPVEDDRGYDAGYFHGLISERMARVRSGGRDVYRWVKIEGHERNEPLDCRNYALAAFAILSPDMERRAREMKDGPAPAETPKVKTARARKKRSSAVDGGEW
jgi:phage terminase large subunit GpA-like protein